ncbi:MAG: hypothetical protein KAJ19_15320 [Gammaproteobacteria bacterium]|nr:hypothetical protein [Gammaproteobacteria bacterium]
MGARLPRPGRPGVPRPPAHRPGSGHGWGGIRPGGVSAAFLAGGVFPCDECGPCGFTHCIEGGPCSTPLPPCGPHPCPPNGNGGGVGPGGRQYTGRRRMLSPTAR